MAPGQTIPGLRKTIAHFQCGGIMLAVRLSSCTLCSIFLFQMFVQSIIANSPW